MDPQLQLLLLLFGTLFIYELIKTREMFVPFNSFEVPIIDKKDAANWDVINDRFGTLLQTINGQKYAIAYHLDDMIQTFTNVLNASGLGKFKVISIGSTQPFTLTDVVVLDQTMQQPIHFYRVDFI